MTRPLRRITLHLSQIFFTLGWTFIAGCRLSIWWVVVLSVWCSEAASAIAEDDPPAGQVIGTEFDHDPVLGQDPDVVLAHLA